MSRRAPVRPATTEPAGPADSDGMLRGVTDHDPALWRALLRVEVDMTEIVDRLGTTSRTASRRSTSAKRPTPTKYAPG